MEEVEQVEEDSSETLDEELDSINTIDGGDIPDVTIIGGDVPEETHLCPGPGPGTYPSTTNCADYYTCTAEAVYQFTCPQGLHYDGKIGACNWPDAVECAVATRNPLFYATSVCAKQGHGLFSDPQHSEKFFWCLRGQPYHMACPYGLYFDSMSGVCNFYGRSR